MEKIIFNFDSSPKIRKTKSTNVKREIILKNIKSIVDVENNEYFCKVKDVNYPIHPDSFSCIDCDFIYYKYLKKNNKRLQPFVIARGANDKNVKIKDFLPFRPGLGVKGDVIEYNGINYFFITKFREDVNTNDELEIYKKWKKSYE